MCAAVFLHSHDNMHMHCTLLLGSYMPTSGGLFLVDKLVPVKGLFSASKSCVLACVRVCVYVIACVHVCMCVCDCVCVHVWVYAHARSCALCVHTCMQACMFAPVQLSG